MNLQKSNFAEHNTQQYAFTEWNKRINTHIETTTQEILQNININRLKKRTQHSNHPTNFKKKNKKKNYPMLSSLQITFYTKQTHKKKK